MADEAVIQAQTPGIFYRRPDPDSPPFVEEGDSVEAGTVVGLVEVPGVGTIIVFAQNLVGV